MSPSPSPEKLAALVSFFQEQKAPLADTTASRLPSTMPRDPRRPDGRRDGAIPLLGPPPGEVNWVPSRHLSFGKNSVVTKSHRPVVALGKTRPPFYLGLPQTSTGKGGQHYFTVFRNDYDVYLSDNNNWPKQIFRFPENIPLVEEQELVGRLTRDAMQRVREWQHPGNWRRQRR